VYRAFLHLVSLSLFDGAAGGFFMSATADISAFLCFFIERVVDFPSLCGSVGKDFVYHVCGQLFFVISNKPKKA